MVGEEGRGSVDPEFGGGVEVGFKVVAEETIIARTTGGVHVIDAHDLNERATGGK